MFRLGSPAGLPGEKRNAPVANLPVSIDRKIHFSPRRYGDPSIFNLTDQKGWCWLRIGIVDRQGLRRIDFSCTTMAIRRDSRW